jgi:hypothetical protein
MKALHIHRRCFLNLSVSAVVTTLIKARADTATESPKIRWMHGGILPCAASSSFVSACAHALSALTQGKEVFSGSEVIFEYTSFLPNGSTVEQVLNQKLSQGEISLGTTTYEGLGTFIHTVNGYSSSSENSMYWRLEVNNIPCLDKGISQKLLNMGDTVRLVLGYGLNDHGIFTDSLGDYTEVLTSQVTPLWKGKILTPHDWPLDEHGSLWHDFFEIVAPENSYFTPNTITCTKHIERFDSARDTWVIVSTIPVSTSATGFVGKSWNNTQETSFDQTSTKMIYGGTGTGFPPIPGSGPEIPRIGARLEWLKTNKIRIRTVVEVSFFNLTGTSSHERYERVTLKAPIPFKSNLGVRPQPLHIKPGEIQFEMPENENGLIEIQTSQDLKEWTSHAFTDDQSKIFETQTSDRLFARTIQY